jgi:hypothetical protein
MIRGKTPSHGSDSPTNTPWMSPHALFHTMADMMTVILRNDIGLNLNPLHHASMLLNLLSGLVSTFC